MRSSRERSAGEISGNCGKEGANEDAENRDAEEGEGEEDDLVLLRER